MVFFLSRGLLGQSGTNAGDIDVGTEVILNENGQPVNYLVVNQGIPESSALYDSSCEGTWLLRKDIKANGAWDSSKINELEGSTIMSTMAGYLNGYDVNVQESIKSVKIPYYSGSSASVKSGANGLECKIFPLCLYEIGYTTSYASNIPNCGAKLNYFDSGDGASARSKRIAYLNSSANSWWVRDPITSSNTSIWNVIPSGSIDTTGPSLSSGGIRPALILPYEFKFQDDQIAA